MCCLEPVVIILDVKHLLVLLVDGDIYLHAVLCLELIPCLVERAKYRSGNHADLCTGVLGKLEIRLLVLFKSWLASKRGSLPCQDGSWQWPSCS